MASTASMNLRSAQANVRIDNALDRVARALHIQIPELGKAHDPDLRRVMETERFATILEAVVTEMDALEDALAEANVTIEQLQAALQPQPQDADKDATEPDPGTEEPVKAEVEVQGQDGHQAEAEPGAEETGKTEVAEHETVTEPVSPVVPETTHRATKPKVRPKAKPKAKAEVRPKATSKAKSTAKSAAKSMAKTGSGAEK